MEIWSKPDSVARGVGVFFVWEKECVGSFLLVPVVEVVYPSRLQKM
jgi:hypothetical protein